MKKIIPKTFKVIFLMIGIPLLMILSIIISFSISEYYRCRMVLPIEWVGVTEENYGKKIDVEFTDMRNSSFYTVEKSFRIGKTEKLILPSSMFLFDPNSVKPSSVKLTLDNPEFIFPDGEFPTDYSNHKIIFTVENNN